MLTFETEILEVIDALGIDELHELSRGSPVGIAEMALQSHVIVLDRSAGEAMLVEASGQAGLLRRRVDKSGVEATDHLVRHSLERPWPQADVF